MKTIKFLLLLFLATTCLRSIAQEIPADVVNALKADDAVKLSAYITNENINNCFVDGDWQYSILSQTVRINAKKCFDLLIEKGADVNKACDDYVPPLMHAAKYGRLDMVKTLVAKGANINYKYEGDYTPANGETPLTYAEKYQKTEVADYLRSLKSK